MKAEALSLHGLIAVLTGKCNADLHGAEFHIMVNHFQMLCSCNQGRGRVGAPGCGRCAGRPLRSQQIRWRIGVTAYKCATVLCDQSCWIQTWTSATACSCARRAICCAWPAWSWPCSSSSVSCLSCVNGVRRRKVAIWGRHVEARHP